MSTSPVSVEETFQSDPVLEIERAVTLKNREWTIVAQSLEAFSEIFRARHSQVIATYLTRGQVEEATAEASLMNELLHLLDKIQSRIA
jgi:hypothetical protein